MTIFLFLPLLIGILGCITYFFHSKRRNMFGYRSQLSLKNDTMWRLAQRTSSLSLISASSFIICLNFMMDQMNYSESNFKIIMISACIFSVLYTIIHTEGVLEKAILKPEYNKIHR